MIEEAMSNPVLSDDPPTPLASDDLGADDLRDLMRAVNETTERLQSTHVTLQTEVVRLKAELAEANAQLRRSRSLAALGQMAAGIAHEIRNPLGSIQLYIQMLGEDLAGQPDQSQLCEKIGRAVTSLDAIVRDVLLFSRDTNVRADATSASELVEQTLHTCEALIVSSRVELELDLPSDSSCALHADACLMPQALGNVIRNAAEAMIESDAGPRHLAITARRRRLRCPDGKQQNRVVISFRDTGPGIPAEVVERMFNPFFTTRKTGTGLGLAIVHRIIDAHGGHINVKNAPAGGALVELCLPLKPIPQKNETPAAETPEIEIKINGVNGQTNGAARRERELALEHAS